MKKLTVSREALSAVVKLAVAIVVAVVLFIMALNGIKNPYDGTTDDYTADFADTSGLHANSDVRIRGIKVGKVTSTDIDWFGDTAVSRAHFTLTDSHWLTADSKLAVKYASLSGVRYLDIENGDLPGDRVRHIPVDRTVPSFDITQLFNGLQPALATLSPDEINTFSTNALTLLQGDGGGFAPMLDSIQRLARFASSREKVISTLVTNLSRISDVLGGKSPEILTILEYLETPVDSVTTVLDEFRKAELYGPGFTTAVDTLLAGFGLNPDLDVDQFLENAFPTIDAIYTAADALPGIFESLAAPGTSGNPANACSKGRAALPELGALLINGSGVVVCQG
ncbi:MlaD family protein [Gordonia terrae]